MGSYGIGLGRVMGTIAEVNSDEHGLVWPRSLAPYLVYVIPLVKKGDDAEVILNVSYKIYGDLQAQGLEVLYDDREKSAGEKFGDADILGIPYRMVISSKTLAEDCVEIKERKTGKIELVKFGKLKEFFNLT